MLSRNDNELLTRVGRGTPMGELLRRFWFPALLEAELPTPDGPPVRLRLLGEDLVAFRDSDGRIGILDAYCAHRRAQLFFGRNEERGLRCAYHGWKYDAEGRCIDMPSEPPQTRCMDRIRLKAYRSATRGGVVWVYMGPPEFAAELPDFEWVRLPEPQRTVTKRLQQCNWAQAVEGGIDSSHISFLHSRSDRELEAKPDQPRNPYHALDRHPVFEVDERDHGLAIAARRNAEESSYYWRITQFLLPFYTLIPPVGSFRDSSGEPYSGHAWVPIDDEHTWTWSFSASPDRPYTEAERAFHGGRNGMWGPVDEHYRPLLNKANDYLLDRERQRTGNFTGIEGIPNQDAAVQESMGPIVDRSLEHLGTSDVGIARFRRLLLRLARDLADGEAPRAAQHGRVYGVRPASLILARKLPYEEGAAPLLYPEPVGVT
jgi:phenylpropionate dioxygenase-like ring-hydroxylating dioxygenase large terminal subunit